MFHTLFQEQRLHTASLAMFCIARADRPLWFRQHLLARPRATGRRQTPSTLRLNHWIGIHHHGEVQCTDPVFIGRAGSWWMQSTQHPPTRTSCAHLRNEPGSLSCDDRGMQSGCVLRLSNHSRKFSSPSRTLLACIMKPREFHCAVDRMLSPPYGRMTAVWVCSWWCGV